MTDITVAVKRDRLGQQITLIVPAQRAAKVPLFAIVAVAILKGTAEQRE
ncbi:hypothetical protein ACJ2_34500 [Pantoea sp. QMID2]|nr:hypothetical protein ACJ3_14970 [Pantoea sp. QMID3]GME35442.1 hypothetical protein ACJ1_14890 [Pantoea sp. QMID1]GME59758.1 hypothetical protein ACJ4_34420 [Pantoea sp. QMID4]GME61278.1 hypothetical protein ACJ2_34500 [Pantoea sp. QMID2]